VNEDDYRHFLALRFERLAAYLRRIQAHKQCDTRESGTKEQRNGH
jgi:hypothetical protein